MAKLYGQRWECEEGIRFLKQALSIEDIRVQSYRAFRAKQRLGCKKDVVPFSSLWGIDFLH
jgi:transposase